MVAWSFKRRLKQPFEAAHSQDILGETFVNPGRRHEMAVVFGRPGFEPTDQFLVRSLLQRYRRPGERRFGR
jgi:hypothetical protein